MMIVEKPGVDIALAQGRLDGGKVHEQITILAMSEALGESCSAPSKNHVGTAAPGCPAERSSAQTAEKNRSCHSEE
jgi:hypothetical protein